MRTFLSALMMALLASPAMADPNPVPEPQSLGLAALGVAVAIWIGRRKKK
jgi:PEP-CTERM motif